MASLSELGAIAPASLSADARIHWRRDALAALGVRRLALILFDAALPRPAASDWGTGSPYSTAARGLFRYARELGFNAVQLGPQGAPSRDNASPYDGTVFSRNPLALDPQPLLEEGSLPLLPRAELETRLSSAPAHLERQVAHAYAFDTSRWFIDTAFERFRSSPGERWSEARRRLARFRDANAHWLIPDALYQCLRESHGGRDFTHWPPNALGLSDATLWRFGTSFDPNQPLATPSAWAGHRLRELAEHFAAPIDAYVFGQWLLKEQHDELRAWAQRQGLLLYGDLHVGCSRGDAWHYQSLFLQNYLLGAPPSRTNPSGQPWGYPVLDPSALQGASGQGGWLWLQARADKLFADYDAVRIDHPHGWVTPWVYRANTGDDLEAVQCGARLYTSPDLAGHPELATYSLVRRDQITSELPRHADDRLRQLDDTQIDAFARAFDIFASHARAHQRPVRDALICELLSTEPFELYCVRRRYRLGRFRVAQKADLSDPSDVYHPAHAAREDWVLLGNHDTPPIWTCIEGWRRDGQLRARIDALAAQLTSSPAARQRLVQRLSRSASELAHAELAQLLCSPAENVLVSFSDLFGFEQPYNRPGIVDAHNWSQRLPRDVRTAHEQAIGAGRALSIDRALQLALVCRARRAGAASA